MWCTFADGSDYLQVFARTEAPDPAHRSRGVTCFLMPKQRGTLPEGVSGNPVRKIGYHGWKTWELSFDDAYAEEIVGELGRGFRIAMGDLDTARIHTAARAIGLARGALERGVPPCRLAGGCGRATTGGGPPGDRTPNPRIKRSGPGTGGSGLCRSGYLGRCSWRLRCTPTMKFRSRRDCHPIIQWMAAP